MDYAKKYYKYKFKYLELKKHLMYGGCIDTKEDSIKITQDKFISLPPEERNKFPFYCHDSTPNMCSLQTPNYGLCKKQKEECAEYTGEQTLPVYDISEQSRRDLYEFGKKYNYDLHDSTNNCSRLKLDAYKEYDALEIATQTVPNNFKIMTYNLWSNLKNTDDEEHKKFDIKFFTMRMNEICRIIIASGADIVCLQEVSQKTFELIYPQLSQIYKFYYEIPFTPDRDNKGERKRSIETICFSKYEVKSYKLFGIEGNLSYNNSMLVLDFDKFIVFNVYLQAGTRNSPGQKDLWFHYSRCRYNEYLSIGKYLRENNITKPIIVLGDFNTNLNGKFDEWPELKAFDKLNLTDAWASLNGKINGYTENTNVNLMRWNVKFEEKIYRIDGIFYTQNKFITENITILGDKPIDIDSEMQHNFVKYRIPPNRSELIRYHEGKIKIWPSDHFAVVTSLRLV